MIVRITLLSLVLSACADPPLPAVKPQAGRRLPRASLTIDSPGSLLGARVSLRWSIEDQGESAEIAIRAQAPGLAPPPDDLEPGSLPARGALLFLAQDGAWTDVPVRFGTAQAMGSADVDLPQGEGEWRFDLMLFEADELTAIDSSSVLVSDRLALRVSSENLTLSAGRMPRPLLLMMILDRPDGSEVSLPAEAPELRFAAQGPAMNQRIALPDRPGNHRLRADLIELETGFPMAGASASWVVEDRPLASDGLPQPAVVAALDTSALPADEIGPAVEAFELAVAQLKSDGIPVITAAERAADLQAHAERMTREDVREPMAIDAVLDFAVVDPSQVEPVLPLIRGQQQRPIAPHLTLSLEASELAVGAQQTAVFSLADADGAPVPDQSISVRHGVNGGDELSAVGRTDGNGMLSLELPATALAEIHAVEGTWTREGIPVRSNRAWYRATGLDELRLETPVPSMRLGESAEITVVTRRAGMPAANETVTLTSQRGTVPANVITGADGTATFAFVSNQPGLGRISASSSIGSGSALFLVESPVLLTLLQESGMIEVHLERGRFDSPGIAIEMSASAGTLDPIRAVTDASGLAKVSFVPPPGNGSATITARVDVRGEVTTAETTVAY